MKSNVTLLRRASSPTFGFGGTAGSRAPLSWIASRPIVGTIGCRSASGAGDCGNCGFMVKVSVALAQVSNSALLPVAPALVLTWMKNCQATLSGSFIAEFASGGAACDHAGFPASSIAPHSRPDAYKLRFITLLPGLSRATVFHPAAIRGTPIGGRAGAPDIAAAREIRSGVGFDFWVFFAGHRARPRAANVAAGWRQEILAAADRHGSISRDRRSLPKVEL